MERDVVVISSSLSLLTCYLQSEFGHSIKVIWDIQFRTDDEFACVRRGRTLTEKETLCLVTCTRLFFFLLYFINASLSLGITKL